MSVFGWVLAGLGSNGINIHLCIYICCFCFQHFFFFFFFFFCCFFPKAAVGRWEGAAGCRARSPGRPARARLAPIPGDAATLAPEVARSVPSGCADGPAALHRKERHGGWLVRRHCGALGRASSACNRPGSSSFYSCGVCGGAPHDQASWHRMQHWTEHPSWPHLLAHAAPSADADGDR